MSSLAASNHEVLQEASFTAVHVDLAKKPAWYSSINSKGLVPAVAFQSHQVTESIDICRSADVSITVLLKGFL